VHETTHRIILQVWQVDDFLSKEELWASLETLSVPWDYTENSESRSDPMDMFTNYKELSKIF